jgi:hypothetical protein
MIKRRRMIAEMENESPIMVEAMSNVKVQMSNQTQSSKSHAELVSASQKVQVTKRP